VRPSGQGPSAQACERVRIPKSAGVAGRPHSISHPRARTAARTPATQRQRPQPAATRTRGHFHAPATIPRMHRLVRFLWGSQKALTAWKMRHEIALPAEGLRQGSVRELAGEPAHYHSSNRQPDERPAGCLGQAWTDRPVDARCRSPSHLLHGDLSVDLRGTGRPWHRATAAFQRRARQNSFTLERSIATRENTGRDWAQRPAEGAAVPGSPSPRTAVWPSRWSSGAVRAHAVVVSVLTPAEILIAARRLAGARSHLAAVAGPVHHEDLGQLCRDELTGADVRIDSWDICGRWFGVVVGATLRLGELRRGETIPWRVIAARIVPREHRRSGHSEPWSPQSGSNGWPLR